jgi:hypothetical protein
MYYNKLKLEGPRFKKRDLVYLLRKNIKIIRLSNKFDYKKFGPFKVKRNIKNISYEFHLTPQHPQVVDDLSFLGGWHGPTP